jgi:heme/copper-type cytochrome/quinol oxidase subunit 3
MKDARRWRETLDTCATFWHFLLAVWLYLFVVLSLV